jgi:hypothetical protein
MTAHWGIPDPAVIEGSDRDKRNAFRAALEARIKLFTNLPIVSLDRMKLREQLDTIGNMPPCGA